MKVPRPEESGRIESHENVYFANGNYERRSSKLADENANCLVVFERSYSYLRLLPAYSKIARTNVKVVKARLIARTCSTPNTGASFQLSDEYGIVEVQVVEMTEAAATKQASVTTLHVSVV